MQLNLDFDSSTQSIDKVYQNLQTSPKGLTASQVDKRLEAYGYNQISQKKATNPLLIFLKQFKSFLILILLAAAVISLFLGHSLDAYIILVVIFANSLIGFIFELQAQKSIDALKEIIKNKARVIRNGELQEVLTKDLVVGDLIVLEEGDRVPADCRLVESKNLYLMEASITGESSEVAKNPDKIEPVDSLGDKTNLLFSSTLVHKGEAKAIVVAIGDKTELGKIASELFKIEDQPSNFEQKSAFLALQLAILAIVVSICVFILGFFVQKMQFVDIFLLTTAVLVSAIPEGLPAIVAIALAVGAKKMSENKAIIRNLNSAQTVGSVNVICTDKTGTLTENKMSAQQIYLPTVGVILPEKEVFSLNKKEILPKSEACLNELLLACDKGNKAIIGEVNGEEEKNLGDQTEIALKKLVYNSVASFETYKILDHFSFNSIDKYQVTLVTDQLETFLIVTGAPEVLLTLSTKTGSSEQNVAIFEYLEPINQQISEFNQKGYRSLAVAMKKIDSQTFALDKNMLQDLVFLGLIAIKDPVREGVSTSVAEANRAGIKVKMLTGDHPQTAISIAQEIGILGKNEDLDRVVFTNTQLEKMTVPEFDQAVREAKVFARLNPLTKLRITQSLQKQGNLVAMTGDGVNDAPALKQADLGISMGKIGTDVARESSDIVLADDNFNTIVLAVNQGRIIFENIRKASYFLLSTNLAEVVTILGAMILGLASPISSVQILWLNLVTDGVNGAALGMGTTNQSLMHKKPSPINENILNKKVLPYLLIMIGVMVPLTLVTYYKLLPLGHSMASSGAFFVMSVTQIFNLVNLKSLDKSSLNLDLVDNKTLNITTIVSLILIIFIPYTVIGNFLGLVPLDWQNTLILFILSSSVLWIMELYKFLEKILTRKTNSEI